MKSLTLLAGGVVLHDVLGPGVARAAGADPKLLLLVYFEGGWDQLLGLDPRNATDQRYQWVGGRAPTSGIDPGYVDTADALPFVDAIMTATGGTGVQSRGALTFGPAVPDSMLAHAADLAIVRGMSMDTVTHEVGRRYLLTGKFPRGLAASGSSLDTVVAAQTGPSVDMPNVVVGNETYNEGLPSKASAVRVASARDMLTVMQAQGPVLPPASAAALRTFEDGDDSCTQHGFDVSGLVQSFKSSRQVARGFVNPARAELFDFKLPAPPALTGLFSAFGLSTAADLSSMRARAALAGQALVNGVSSVVSVQLANGLDDHFDIYSQQAPAQRDGFDALGRLIAYLKANPAPGTPKNLWECTTMMVFSEFSRTPLINARNGRDHHLVSSCLLSGPGLRGNTVFGASSDQGMGAQKWDFTTGALDPNQGSLIRPCDVHATLLSSMGLSYSHLSNQSPKVLTALRR